MPESAEVRINAEQIKPHLIGQHLQNLNIYNTSRYKSVPPQGFSDLLQEIKSGKQIIVQDIKTHGKFLYWEMSEGWYLMNTLGMTGQWSKDPGKHPCISIETVLPPLRGINSVFFNDPRHFGTIKFTKDEKEIQKKLKRLGWDPFSGIEESTVKALKKKLVADERPIADVLLDQAVISGTGNYLRSEILYAAKISPHKPAYTLTEAEIYTICQNTVEIVNRAYEENGATISTYKSPDGKKGNFSLFFKVYKRKTDPLGNPITKEETSDARTIYWVPAIQK